MTKSTDWIIGASRPADSSDFSEEIAFRDHKIGFAVRHCRDKDVLDVGCVQHNPENYQSRFWMHRALTAVSRSVQGLDIYEEGVEYLRKKGYKVFSGDAQDFSLEQDFDVIVAGDLIEHLENPGGFLASCREHLRPGGVLLISTPNPWYWRNVAKAALFARVSNNPEHTFWICPITLQQLAARHSLEVTEVTFGSRYARDRLIPLPKGLKHTSWHAALRSVSS